MTIFNINFDIIIGISYILYFISYIIKFEFCYKLLFLIVFLFFYFILNELKYRVPDNKFLKRINQIYTFPRLGGTTAPLVR